MLAGTYQQHARSQALGPGSGPDYSPHHFTKPPTSTRDSSFLRVSSSTTSKCTFKQAKAAASVGTLATPCLVVLSCVIQSNWQLRGTADASSTTLTGHKTCQAALMCHCPLGPCQLLTYTDSTMPSGSCPGCERQQQWCAWVRADGERLPCC
jgi:hypothetical protein